MGSPTASPRGSDSMESGSVLLTCACVCHDSRGREQHGPSTPLAWTHEAGVGGGHAPRTDAAGWGTLFSQPGLVSLCPSFSCGENGQVVWEGAACAEPGGGFRVLGNALMCRLPGLAQTCRISITGGSARK